MERKAQDRWVGIVILAVGAVLFYDTFFFHEVNWVPLGMAFWPRILLAGLAALSLYFIVRGSLDGGPYEHLAPISLVILAGCFGYVLLMDSVGWLVVTPAFIFVLSVFLGDRSRRCVVQALFSAIFGTAVVYAVFHYGLDVQIPEGLLEIDA